MVQGAGAYAFKGFTSIIASALILWLSFALLKFMVRLLVRSTEISWADTRRCRGQMHACLLSCSVLSLGCKSTGLILTGVAIAGL